jgi:hypothetical protein
MAKPTKSQWDFGELFPPEELREVLSVSELTLQVKRLLEKSVGLVWLGGRIMNLRRLPLVFLKHEAQAPHFPSNP